MIPFSVSGAGGSAYGEGSAGGAGLLGDATVQKPISGISGITIGGFNAPPVPEVPGMPTFAGSIASAPAQHPVVWLFIAGIVVYFAKRKGWF